MPDGTYFKHNKHYSKEGVILKNFYNRLESQSYMYEYMIEIGGGQYHEEIQETLKKNKVQDTSMPNINNKYLKLLESVAKYFLDGKL